MPALVTTVSPTKTAEPIEVPSDVSTRVGPRNHVSDGDPDPRAILGSVSWPTVKYGKYLGCSRYHQPRSVGGSSDAVFRCQQCSIIPILDITTVRYFAPETGQFEFAATTSVGSAFQIRHIVSFTGCGPCFFWAHRRSGKFTVHLTFRRLLKRFYSNSHIPTSSTDIIQVVVLAVVASLRLL